VKKIILPLLLLVILAWLQPLHFGQREVVIAKNATATQIADVLEHRGVLRSRTEFLACLKLSGKGKSLRAGTFVLDRYKNPFYIIQRLTSGGKTDILVTIPEGRSLYETADILKSKGVANREEFIRLCSDRNFINTLGIKTTNLEGCLFPDTYSFRAGSADSQVIRVLVDNFLSRMQKYGVTDPDSFRKVLILASLVEKEAKYDDERPIIARVFLNRLQNGRPLESCATVIYAIKNNPYDLYDPEEIRKIALTEKDLKVQSPYNTYLYAGLPPGPICSPGEKSIAAAIRPADSDYLYFVAKGDGRHQFSRTYREHLAAKAQYIDKK
jgi:UPF0755 protein